jgi:4-aminobutyrate aminotransferase-like enzyme
MHALNAIRHPNEPQSNAGREATARLEPVALRTFTPTQAVIAKSAGAIHFTPESRRLYDYTSGVLVSNLGHNPTEWTRRYFDYMGWPAQLPAAGAYFAAVPMTAYNAITPIEVDASKRLLDVLRAAPGGARMERVMWAASGSEAIQKALWAALARDRTRSMIVATRFGFHGKKGLANAVTGSEAELDALLHQFGRKLAVLITEPYLGGGGSYHPPKAYLQLLQRFCRDNDLVFILDEVQSNFGRTGALFAYETYGLEPDVVVLGKGLGNGVPVAAAVGRSDLFGAMGYGEASDTWSANPLCCAAVLATLDEFAARDVLGAMRESSALIERGLVGLKALPFVAAVRGERGGMVWGVETRDHAGRTAAEWASALVLAAYEGDGPHGDGIHLLGPLAKKVVRVSPPLTITANEAAASIALLSRAAQRIA